MERLRRSQVRDVSRQEPMHRTGSVAVADEPGQSPADDFDGSVQVIYGAGVQTLPLVGLRISDARPLLETILRVDPRSPAVINGRQVRADHVIARDEVLEFVHHAGEKG
jgi:hypothetical protein